MQRKLLALVVAAAALAVVGIGGAAAAPSTGSDAGVSHATNDTDTTRFEEDDIVLLDRDAWSRLDDGWSSATDDATGPSAADGTDNIAYTNPIPARNASDEPEYDEKLTADESITLDFDEDEVTRQGDGIFVIERDDEE